MFDTYYILDEKNQATKWEGDLYTATQLGEKLNLSAKALNKKLIELGIVVRRDTHTVDPTHPQLWGKYTLMKHSGINRPLFKWNREGAQMILELVGGTEKNDNSTRNG